LWSSSDLSPASSACHSARSDVTLACSSTGGKLIRLQPKCSTCRYTMNCSEPPVASNLLQNFCKTSKDIEDITHVLNSAASPGRPPPPA
jgi:hypothetical protein